MVYIKVISFIEIVRCMQRASDQTSELTDKRRGNIRHHKAENTTAIIQLTGMAKIKASHDFSRDGTKSLSAVKTMVAVSQAIPADSKKIIKRGVFLVEAGGWYSGPFSSRKSSTDIPYKSARSASTNISGTPEAHSHFDTDLSE